MSSDFEKYVNKKLKESLEKELIGLYECEPFRLFLTLIKDAGFPVAELHRDNTTWKGLITEFLSKCRSLSLDKLNNIFFKLHETHPGYQDLKTVSDIFKKEVEKNNPIQENREFFSNPQNSDGLIPDVADEIIIQELSTLYADDLDLFRSTIAGFPLETIPQGKAPKIIVFNFLSRCKGLDNDKKLKIFKALYNENRGSNTLSIVVRLLEEQCN